MPESNSKKYIYITLGVLLVITLIVLGLVFVFRGEDRQLSEDERRVKEGLESLRDLESGNATEEEMLQSLSSLEGSSATEEEMLQTLKELR